MKELLRHETHQTHLPNPPDYLHSVPLHLRFRSLSRFSPCSFLSHSSALSSSRATATVTRPRPVFLINYLCFKPSSYCKCTYGVSESFVRRSRLCGPKSVEFMRKVYLKSGPGDATYGPPFMFRTDYEEARLEFAKEEALEGIFLAVDSLLAKTAVHPQAIDVLTPSPSLSSLIVNRYKLRPGVKVFDLSGMGCSSGVLSIDLALKFRRHSRSVHYALEVITESISLNWYFGDSRSMLVSNCIFRVGCATALLINEPARCPAAKFELVRSLRTHHGADDCADRATFQEEDDEGNAGIALTKDLVPAAATNLLEHIKILAPEEVGTQQVPGETFIGLNSKS